MKLALKLHPGSPATAVMQIAVEIARAEHGRLSLRYLANGPISRLRLPHPAAPVRTDDLWRSTCFEAFIRRPDGRGYCELNFSPSSQWAAYRFTSYREGMSNIDDVAPPQISTSKTAAEFELKVLLDLGEDRDRFGVETWQIGLSAVIEDSDGVTAYWALAHPPGKPDFHHADGFACQLSIAEPS